MPSHYQNYRVPSYTDLQHSSGAPREVERLNVEKTNDVGIARFRAGDYAGALVAFKQIVVNDFSNPAAKLWMAMALAGAGDFKNAEKALRSASASNEQLSGVDLKGSLKDPKETARFSAAAEKAGGITAGYILERLGEKEKAKAALETALKAAPKDGEAEKLKARVN
jgi:Flp pilus assembly protein TadD